MSPRVLLFTGHIIDPANRENARFPFALVEDVQKTIRVELDDLLGDIPSLAISSLAAGGDMLFAEEMIRRGIPLEIFLPFDRDKFLAASVKYVKGIPGEDPSEWENDFNAVLSQATVVHELECDAALSVCYASCNEAMLNYALMMANNDPKDVLALALMRDSNGVVRGGTADFVKQIQSRDIHIKKVWPSR